MLKELRKDILRLLKEDEEFRYAVAGLIGLEDIRSSVKRLDDAVARLAESQSRVETRLEGVETEVKGVKDRLDKVETRLEGVETEVKGVKDRLDKVETGVKVLERRFNGLEGALYHGFEQLGRFAGVSLEELVRSIITKSMRDAGELREDKAITSVSIDGEEIDVFCDDPLIVGEVTSYAESVEEVEKLLRKVKMVRERYGREPSRKLLIISSVRTDAADDIVAKARENGVEVIMGKRV